MLRLHRAARPAALLLSVFLLCTACSCLGPTKPTPSRAPDASAPSATPGDAPPANAALTARCREILARYGATVDGIYAYINNTDPAEHFTYDARDMLEVLPAYDTLALYLLDTGHGVCYHYAALTYYLLDAAGFEALIIHGFRHSDQALHYWTMVRVDGNWYHFDPLHHQKLLTDEQKSGEQATGGNGMEWDTALYPHSA